MQKFTLIFLLMFSAINYASDPKIIKVKVERTPAQKYNISVTLEHADTGWEHFAHAWKVYTPDGKLLGERVLYHPHVKEQPFTRTLSGLHIPAGLESIIITANCSDTGEADKSYTVNLR